MTPQFAFAEAAPRRVANVIVQLLADAGVSAVFGVPGGAISPVYDALLDEPRIRVINTHHENAAVYAAAAWAKAKGTVGVVLTTSGPGITNALTGIASAHADGMPVLVLGGEVPRKNYGRGALQEGGPYAMNVVSMLRHVTKLSAEVTSADLAGVMIQKAMQTAQSGRKGPVFLSLPLDILGAQTTPPRLVVGVEARFALDEAAVDLALAHLMTAERPMILAGSGCRWGNGPRVLRSLAERLSIPVCTTPKAKGVFPESHPLSLGVHGHGGSTRSAQYVREGIDVILAVGTSLGDASTNGWTAPLRASRAFIQVDIDSTQLGRNYHVDLGLVGSAADVLGALEKVSPPMGIPNRRVHVPSRLEAVPDQTEHSRLTSVEALKELQSVLPTSAVYVSDIGNHMIAAIESLKIDRPDAFHVYSGLGSMTSSLGSALGLKLAHPDRPVVVVCGDGTLSMSSGEIATAVNENLSVLFFVVNDGKYGMVEGGHRAIYGRTPTFETKTDVTAIAKSLGARTLTVSSRGEMLELGAQLLPFRGPVVVDARVVGHGITPPARFDDIKNGQARAPTGFAPMAQAAPNLSAPRIPSPRPSLPRPNLPA